MSKWPTKPLGEVCEFTSGLWKGKKPPFTRIGVLRMTNFASGGALDYGDVAEIEVETGALKKRALTPGDLLLEKSGGGPNQPVGRVCVFERDDALFSFSNFTARMRVANPTEMDYRFLHKYLFWLHLSGATEGLQNYSTNIRNLNMRAYKEVRVPVPALSEQQRIVAVLDEAFDAIARAEVVVQESIRSVRLSFDGALADCFSGVDDGWITATLGEVTTKIGSGATPRGGERSYQQAGVSLIRSLNVHDTGFRRDRLAFLGEDQASRLSNVTVAPGDVLLNITGASIARCCVVPGDVLPARVNQHVAILRTCPERVHPRFLYYELISRPHKRLLLGAGEEGGSTRQAITKAQIERYRVVFPESVDVQARIVAALDALAREVDDGRRVYQRKLDALAELKRSLLHEAFSGNL